MQVCLSVSVCVFVCGSGWVRLWKGASEVGCDCSAMREPPNISQHAYLAEQLYTHLVFLSSWPLSSQSPMQTSAHHASFQRTTTCLTSPWNLEHSLNTAHLAPTYQTSDTPNATTALHLTVPFAALHHLFPIHQISPSHISILYISPYNVIKDQLRFLLIL